MENAEKWRILGQTPIFTGFERGSRGEFMENRGDNSDENEKNDPDKWRLFQWRKVRKVISFIKDKVIFGEMEKWSRVIPLQSFPRSVVRQNPREAAKNPKTADERDICDVRATGVIFDKLREDDLNFATRGKRRASTG